MCIYMYKHTCFIFFSIIVYCKILNIPWIHGENPLRGVSEYSFQCYTVSLCLSVLHISSMYLLIPNF